jgi:hypothetical protein
MLSNHFQQLANAIIADSVARTPLLSNETPSRANWADYLKVAPEHRPLMSAHYQNEVP